MKIENLQRELINAQKVLHSNFPGLFIKFDFQKIFQTRRERTLREIRSDSVLKVD